MSGFFGSGFLFVKQSTMTMTEYELFYVIGESKESEMVRIKSEIKAIVEGEGGHYSGEEKVEKRKLAYMVKRESRGTYTAQRFTTPGKDERDENGEGASIIGRIDHKLHLYRDVLRFLIVRANELPALLQEEEDESSKIVAEVAKEAQMRKAATERKSSRVARSETVAPVISTPIVEVIETEKTKEKKTVKKETEDALDKKLEEVLNI